MTQLSLLESDPDEPTPDEPVEDEDENDEVVVLDDAA